MGSSKKQFIEHKSGSGDPPTVGSTFVATTLAGSAAKWPEICSRNMSERVVKRPRRADSKQTTKSFYRIGSFHPDQSSGTAAKSACRLSSWQADDQRE